MKGNDIAEFIMTFLEWRSFDPFRHLNGSICPRLDLREFGRTRSISDSIDGYLKSANRKKNRPTDDDVNSTYRSSTVSTSVFRQSPISRTIRTTGRKSAIASGARRPLPSAAQTVRRSRNNTNPYETDVHVLIALVVEWPQTRWWHQNAFSRSRNTIFKYICGFGLFRFANGFG